MKSSMEGTSPTLVRDSRDSGNQTNGHWSERASFSENAETDRKSTRLNSSHLVISYAVFCLKKKSQICNVTPRSIPRRPDPRLTQATIDPLLYHVSNACDHLRPSTPPLRTSRDLHALTTGSQ